MIVCITVSEDGRAGGGWGRAHRVALATTSAGAITDWREVEVGWDAAHDEGTEGSHHARIARFLGRMEMTEAQREADSLLEDPVGEALRQGVRTLGERLYEIGGLDLMQDAIDRVASLDAATWGHRTDIMDKRWDGIGRTEGKAGWCC